MHTNPHTLDPVAIRAEFPALNQSIDGRTPVFLDGPGGTQSPHAVLDAMSGYLQHGSSNQGGAFHTSRATDETVQAAREAMADLLNAEPNEIVFGQNMTSLTFSMSRALARTWSAGDEIIVSRIDHDANISPWLQAAVDRGVTVRWLDFRSEDCTLALDTLPAMLNERTRLIAVNYASNAVGTISDVARVTELAHAADALVYIDAVHFAPHALIDVKALDCDFLACSVYKFFGPHTGVLYGKYELLDSLEAYKVRPAPARPPGKWETGTQSFESLAGVTAAVNYMASLGEDADSRRARLESALGAIQAYEQTLCARFLEQATRTPGLRVYGLTDIERLDERTPTFAISLEGHTPEAVAAYLGEREFYVWDGHYYAIEVMDRLGTLEQGGLVRIGFVHYNTLDEVDRLFDALRELAKI